jgi:hypothetical protein
MRDDARARRHETHVLALRYEALGSVHRSRAGDRSSCDHLEVHGSRGPDITETLALPLSDHWLRSAD